MSPPKKNYLRTWTLLQVDVRRMKSTFFTKGISFAREREPMGPLIPKKVFKWCTPTNMNK